MIRLPATNRIYVPQRRILYSWTPASEPSLLTWLEAVDVPATLVQATQPTILNASFETGDPPTGWALYNATYTEPTRAADTGRTGSGQSMLITVTDAADVNGWVGQNASLIIGNRYTASAWAKGDGASGLAISDANGFFWQSNNNRHTPASTDWALYSGERTVTNVFVDLYDSKNPAAIGTQAWYDDVTVTNLTRTRWNPRAGSAGGYFSQATANYQPWFNSSAFSGKGAVQVAKGDALTHSGTTSDFKCLHDGTGATIVVRATIDSLAAANNQLLATCAYNYANVGSFITVNGSGAILFIVANGSGAAALTCAAGAGAISINTDYIITVTLSATTAVIRVNGTQVVTAGWTLAPSAAASTLPLGASYVGGSGITWTGNIKSVQVYNSVLSADKLALAEAAA